MDPWPRAAPPRAPRAGAACGVAPSSSRTVNSGSSARTVPAPTKIASGPGPQAMDVAAGLLPGDPAAGAVGCGGPRIEAGGHLQDDPGPAGGAVLEIRRQLLAHLVGAAPTVTSIPAARSAATPRPATMGVGVLDGDDHPGHAGRDDGVGTGRRPPMVGAGLQGGEQGRPPGVESPARANAATSACGPPGGAVAPSKTCAGSWPETTTQPTQGFGAVVPRTDVGHRHGSMHQIAVGALATVGRSRRLLDRAWLLSDLAVESHCRCPNNRTRFSLCREAQVGAVVTPGPGSRDRTEADSLPGACPRQPRARDQARWRPSPWPPNPAPVSARARAPQRSRGENRSVRSATMTDRSVKVTSAAEPAGIGDGRVRLVDVDHHVLIEQHAQRG